MLGSLELCCYLILNNNTFLFFFRYICCCIFPQLMIMLDLALWMPLRWSMQHWSGQLFLQRLTAPFQIPVEIGSVLRTWLFFMRRNYPLPLEVGAVTTIIYTSILTYLKLTIKQCGFLLQRFVNNWVYTRPYLFRAIAHKSRIIVPA